MANKILEQKLIDSTDRALVKYVLVGDGTAAANVTLLDASSLRYALNTSGQLMSSNTNPRPSYRTSIKRIYGQARASTGHYDLQWGGTSNNEIVTIASGVFDFNFEAVGGSISNDDASPTGDILLTARAPAAGDSLTVFIDLKKDPRDFDRGQSLDPTSFNLGAR